MRIALAISAFALLSLPAPASAEDALDQAFGNTIVSRYTDGGWVKHWFEPDGRYRAQWSQGRVIEGRWRVEGEKICLNNIRPAIMMISRFCSPLVRAQMGQTWRSRDPLGRQVVNTLVPGRQ